MNSPNTFYTREFRSFSIADIKNFKAKMLNWANRFNICCLLDNQHYQLPHHSYDLLVAAGAISVFEPGEDFFHSLSQFDSSTNDWIFGHFSYDLKNRIEELTSSNIDNIHFPDAFLFVPEIVLQLKGNNLLIGSVGINAKTIFKDISNQQVSFRERAVVAEVKARIQKENYLHVIDLLREHIRRGDCYEINFCQEFYVEGLRLDPSSLYERLVTVSPNPFSAYYKIDDKYLLCASPERYLKKEGETILSQPIKGTSQRFPDNAQADVEQRTSLQQSKKDRSENVMIVDLVRNDLSRVCKEGSVKVHELFEVYSFPQVHQMISTIVGTLRHEIDLAAIIKATFPMGSMTGAPKKRVMELIEKYEETKRGIYSGAVGYITPGKDFDFNVVIRSIMYNETNAYLSYQVGSAITYSSDPQKEYEECLLKVEAIKKVLR